jgi:hypothetical protein
VELQDGVVEVCGVVLVANGHYKYAVCVEKPLVLNSMEGGSFSLSTKGNVDISKFPMDVTNLMRCARQLSFSAARVAVLGERGAGKTYVAQFISNIVIKSGCTVLYCDLNVDSNTSYCPGCISVTAVTQPSKAVFSLGESIGLDNLSVAFSVGSVDPPAPLSLPIFLHFVSQLDRCRDSLRQSIKDVSIFDVGTPAGSVPFDTYLKRVIEVIQPTHVVTVSSPVSLWSKPLQEDVGRTLPNCEFLQTIALNAVGDKSDKSQATDIYPLIARYFAGSVNAPLGSSKVVFSSGKLKFFELTVHGGQVRADILHPSFHNIAGRLCAISHAVMEHEVPFANVAGLLFVTDYDEESGEVVAVVPSGDESLPNAFLIVPPHPTLGSWELLNSSVSV